ncbi:kelch repeat-containing protein [Aurantibacter sp.]|uniref:Kelch repeat-containing protein n=1 Tax=Aurantibacter sp. TaxID=2807103 RepID=UPI003263EFF8
MKNCILFVCFFAMIACNETKKLNKAVSEVETPNNEWNLVTLKMESKPVERHEAAFVRVKDKFYLLGGRGIRPVSIFNPDTMLWSQGSKPPLELHHFQPVVFEDRIYIISALTGGYPNEKPTEFIYSYDPESDSWTKGDTIPENRRRGSTGNVLYNGKIYISCGIKNGHIGDHKNWMDSYNPKSGEWKMLSDAPRARDHFQAVQVDDKIYLAAGRNTGKFPEDGFAGTIGEVDVYDIKSDTWTTLTNNIPTERAGTAAIVYNDKVLIAGGESSAQEKAHSEVEALDLKTSKWENSAFLNEGRHGTGLLEYNGALYIASGCGNRGGEPELFTMETYKEDY